MVHPTLSPRGSWKRIIPSKSADHVKGLHLTPNGCCYVYTYDRTLSDLYLADGFR